MFDTTACRLVECPLCLCLIERGNLWEADRLTRRRSRQLGDPSRGGRRRRYQDGTKGWSPSCPNKCRLFFPDLLTRSTQDEAPSYHTSTRDKVLVANLRDLKSREFFPGGTPAWHSFSSQVTMAPHWPTAKGLQWTWHCAVDVI